MMKIFFLIPITFLAAGSLAQNVGIGNPTPAEKLDVNGNINVTGTIKTNGTDGAAGQVLMKNSAGVLNWGNLGDYKNIAAFTDTVGSSINWTVPAGITNLWVELWGGGGAGLNTGGGGGGYMSLLFTVTPGQSLQVTVGKGGKDAQILSGSLLYNQSGSASRIDIAGQYYLANGGGGALTSTAFSYPQYTPGAGGTFFVSTAATTSPRGPFYTESGEPGGLFKYEYNTITSNQYYRHTYYGDGGAAANTNHFAAKGSYEEFTFIISPASNTRNTHNPARPGNFPGGGGGGGPFLTNDIRNGANGLVLIHY